MKVANGQLAGHNSLIIDTKITPSGLEAVIDIESKSLDHSLRFISENNSCSLIHRNSAEVKKLISKIKGSFFYRCINSRYNKHLGFKDLFNEALTFLPEDSELQLLDEMQNDLANTLDSEELIGIDDEKKNVWVPIDNDEYIRDKI